MPVAGLSPFAGPESEESPDAGGRPGRDFRDARVQPGITVFEALREQIAIEHRQGRRVVVSAFTKGARERLATLFREHEVGDTQPILSWDGLADRA